MAPDHLGFGLSDAPPADEFAYTFDADRPDRRPARPPGRRPLRHLRPGLRCPDRMAPRPERPRGDQRDHHPERQRLRGRLRRRLLGDGLGLPVRADSADRGGDPRGAHPRCDQVAVPHRRARPEPRQPGHLAPRSCPGLPPRQRPHPTGPLP
ncbi:hypothetical protein ABT362_33490 [Nonomuraea rubra]|uniref:hypothetical protein n=1 Tax=Nonomuraea rubra TaxID=46180 RepID=UPI003133B5FB